MKNSAIARTTVLSLLGLLLGAGLLAAPGYADMMVQVNPNIINIDANRLGDIRIFTNLRYSVYRSDEVFLYVNGCENSVAPISKSSDSLGNLILRFQLGSLLATEGVSLNIDAANTFEVVVMHLGVPLVAQDDDVYVMDKKID